MRSEDHPQNVVVKLRPDVTDMLEVTKEENLESVMIIGMRDDGTIFEGWAGMMDPFRFCGVIDAAVHSFKEEFIYDSPPWEDE